MLSVPLKIKIELLKKGITGGRIASRIGVTRAAISLTIKGDIKSKRLRLAICHAAGLPVSIWKKLEKERRAA